MKSKKIRGEGMDAGHRRKQKPPLEKTTDSLGQGGRVKKVSPLRQFKLSVI